MWSGYIIIFLLIAVGLIDVVHVHPTHNNGIQTKLQRSRRQFDFTLSAEHDDKEDETEIALEAIAGLWRSADSKTQVEGSAKVIHRANSLQSGNTRYSGRLHVHREYKRK